MEDEEEEGHRRENEVRNHSCLLGRNSPAGLAMVLAEKSEAFMSTKK